MKQSEDLSSLTEDNQDNEVKFEFSAEHTSFGVSMNHRIKSHT